MWNYILSKFEDKPTNFLWLVVFKMDQKDDSETVAFDGRQKFEN